MAEVLAQLNQYPIRTRLSLSGTLVVARDIAHAKLQERLNSGQGLPEYIQNHPVYYAGPAKTPEVTLRVQHFTLSYFFEFLEFFFWLYLPYIGKPSLKRNVILA